MSKRRKCSLKPLSLKVEFLGKKGKRKESISLAVKNFLNTKEAKEVTRADRESEETSTSILHEDLDNFAKLGNYQSRKIKTNQKWSEIRQILVDTAVEDSCIPPSSVCCVCSFETAVVRCCFCGPQQFFCHSCAIELHSERNYFHVMDLWKDGMFVPMYSEVIIKRPNHQCNFVELKEITFIDEFGNHHTKRVQFCKCESTAATLLRLQFWPGSPERPTIAVHLRLMEMLRIHFLHCKASLKELCESLQLLKPQLQHEMVSSIYAVLSSGSFEEYRFFMHQMKYLTNFFPQLDSGTTCPLCPKEKGILIESMDACFGLARRKRTDQIVDLPKHGTLFFADQNDVDNFVNSHSQKAEDVKEDCSKFHAGEVTTSLRSKGKNKLFDEKAVFGRVCRHDFPKGFHSIKYGERIGYSLYELKRVQEQIRQAPDLKVVMMYDIACTLSTHLKKNNILGNDLRKFTLAIPIFHSYGHKASCQVLLSPRRVNGIGLSDGEGTERLWANLRDFSRITKEMASDKRVDVLTDGLLHYGNLLIQKFGPLLKTKMLRTSELYTKTCTDLETAKNGLPGVIDNNVIEQWMQEEIKSISDPKEDSNLEWDEMYVELLLSLQKHESKVKYDLLVEDEDLNSAKKKVERIARSLNSLEKKHGIKKRWTLNTPAATNAKARLVRKRKIETLTKLHRLACERTFLLEMKKKYADGQSIAIKLSKQIDKVVTTMQDLIAKDSSLLQSEPETELTFEEIKNPCSSLYDDAQLTCRVSADTPLTPLADKKMIINLYCTKKRCEEEKEMLEEEVKRLDSYYNRERSLILDCVSSIEATNNVTVRDLGLSCILKTKSYVLTRKLLKLHGIFKDMPEVINSFLCAEFDDHDTLNVTNEEEVRQVAENFLDNYLDEAIPEL